MAAIVNGSELVLTGTVGDDFWGFDDCFTQADVIMALAQMGETRDIVVRLNSGGGLAWEGSAIHAAFARHKGKVTMVVEGCAASAASVIAMAGDDVQMTTGSVMMIHDPSGFTVGTADDHQQTISMLDALADSLAGVYAAKTKKTAAECRTDMRAEIWLTPEDAVARGYADRIAEANDNDPDEPVEPAPFAYAAYRHPPRQITALADARRWPKALMRKSAQPRPTASSDAAHTEKTMTVKTEAAPAPGPKDVAPAAPAVEQAAVSRADAAEIIGLCHDAGVPAMAQALVLEGVGVPEARARIDSASKINDVVALARRQNPALPVDYAEKAIAAGKSVKDVRADLFDALAAKAEENPVTSHKRAGAGGSDTAGGPEGSGRALSRANMVKLCKQAWP